MKGRPDWFEGFFTEAEQFARMGRDHGLLETVLGIAKRLDRGHVRVARHIYESARPQLFHLRSGGVGETDSTQVHSMLRSGRYPEDVVSRIQNLFP